MTVMKLCGCGSCNDAFPAAIKLFKQMDNGEDCETWLLAVAEALVIVARTNLVACGVNILVEERGAPVDMAISAAAEPSKELRAQIAHTFIVDREVKGAVCDVVCERQGEAIREPIMREHPALDLFAQVLKELSEMAHTPGAKMN